ncbi:MAG TPA: DUF2589 domain-containing protein [Streptosporangiaceae bacterium]|nr:DUF2589 domain-containing protein [Streptosporangiaceae bacterium]
MSDPVVGGEATSNFLLHQILAAPLAALVRAESLSSMAFLDVINTIGFEPSVLGEDAAGLGANLGNLRTVAFRYDRQLPDGTSRQMIMQLPVLSLIPLPLIEVKESTFSFDVALTDIQTTNPVPEATVVSATELAEVQVAVALPPSSQDATANAAAGPLMNIRTHSVIPWPAPSR